MGLSVFLNKLILKTFRPHYGPKIPKITSTGRITRFSFNWYVWSCCTALARRIREFPKGDLLIVPGTYAFAWDWSLRGKDFLRPFSS